MARTRVLNDRYEIEAPLGQGGMATVYRSTDRVLNRTVAVKVLSDRFAADEKFVTRFRREAQAAAGLNHPNIVSIYDTGDHGEAHYIVMEYVEGETLGDMLRREGALPPQRAADIAAFVAAALEVAHGAGLVHRDVKPGNVMLTPEGVLKVMDFGIARAAADDSLTQTGAVLGTAAYLSPEQAQGLPVDARSDLYSLGCVLYEMLTGVQPFTGDSPVSIAYKHVNEEAAPPSRVNPDVPPDLDTVTMRAMAKVPDDRFPTAGAMREALATTAGIHAAEAVGAATEPITGRRGDTAVMPPVAAEEQPPTGEGPPGGPRRWLPIALVVAALVGLVGLALVALTDGRDGSRREPPAAEETAAAVSVDQAIAGLDDVILEGAAAGEISDEASEKILERADAAANKYSEGDLDGALEELGKVRDETDAALAQGEITSSVRADAIHEAVDLVAAAMQASPPPPAEEESPPPEEEGDEGGDGGSGGGSGPGSSEEAPGHNKDGDKGKD
jgi:eukaryotic-like serine/threonine-protein kinase